MLDTREIKKVLVVFLSIAVVLGGFVGIRSLMNNDKKEPEVQVNDNTDEDKDVEVEEDVVEDIPSIVEPTVSSDDEDEKVQTVSKEKPVIDLKDNYVVNFKDTFELPTMDKDSNGNKVTTVITYEFLPFDSLEYYSVTGIDTSKLGTYKVTYKVTNAYGTTVKVIYIEIVDNEAPVVSANVKEYETVENERVEKEVPVQNNGFVNDTVYFSFSDNDEISYAEYYKAKKEIVNGEETLEKYAMQDVQDINLEEEFFLMDEGEYHIRVTDRSGNTTEFIVTIDHTQAIEEKQVVNQNGDEIKVSITFNEKVQEVEGWTLSEDGKTLSKVYTEEKLDTIKVKDLAGNEINVDVNAYKIIVFEQDLGQGQIPDLTPIRNDQVVNINDGDIYLTVNNQEDGHLTIENTDGVTGEGPIGVNNIVNDSFVNSSAELGTQTLTYTSDVGNTATFTLTIVDQSTNN